MPVTDQQVVPHFSEGPPPESPPPLRRRGLAGGGAIAALIAVGLLATGIDPVPSKATSDVTPAEPEVITTSTVYESRLAGGWNSTALPGAGTLLGVIDTDEGYLALVDSGDIWHAATASGWRSVDGASWEPVEISGLEGSVSVLTATSEGWLAVGAAIELPDAAEPIAHPRVWESEDGVTWRLKWRDDAIHAVAVWAEPVGAGAAVGILQQPNLYGENGPARPGLASRWAYVMVGDTGRAALPDGNVAALDTSGDRWVAAGARDGSARVWVSDDQGRSWDEAAAESRWPVGAFTSLARVPRGGWTGVVTSSRDLPGWLWVSTDGEEWGRVESSQTVRRFDRVIGGGDGVVAVTGGLTFNGAARLSVWTSADGESWFELDVPAGCGSCDPSRESGSVSIRSWAELPAGPVMIGSVGRHPVMWSRGDRITIEVPTPSGPHWEEVMRRPLSRAQWVAYASPAVMVTQSPTAVEVTQGPSAIRLEGFVGGVVALPGGGVQLLLGQADGSVNLVRVDGLGEVSHLARWDQPGYTQLLGRSPEPTVLSTEPPVSVSPDVDVVVMEEGVDSIWALGDRIVGQVWTEQRPFPYLAELRDGEWAPLDLDVPTGIAQVIPVAGGIVAQTGPGTAIRIAPDLGTTAVDLPAVNGGLRQGPEDLAVFQTFGGSLWVSSDLESWEQIGVDPSDGITMADPWPVLSSGGLYVQAQDLGDLVLYRWTGLP